MDTPDLVLFETHESINPLKQKYPSAKYIFIDLGAKETELACLLFCHNISGIISPMLNVDMFCKALETVYRGEIWLEQSHVKTLLKVQQKYPHANEIRAFSDQDQCIIRLITEGKTNKEIAAHLCLSLPTIKAHLTRIYKALQVNNRSQLVALATQCD